MGTLDYYTAVVRLAPDALPSAAARRVQGVARQALYRRRERIDEAQLLLAFGVASAEGLVEAALSTRPGAAWCEGDHRASVLEALVAIEGAEARALERADRAARGEFDVFGTRVSFREGAAIDWSRDPVSGFRYPVVPVEALRLQHRGVDPKYPWVLGRLDSLVALGQGYWVGHAPEARSRFARAFVHQALDFLAANPVGMGVHWACPMEVALRAANLAQALVMFADAPEVRRPEFLVPVLGALVEHAAFVEANLEDGGAVPNNHLVSNYVGMLVVGLLFPELPGSPRQVALASEGLRAQMRAQVNSEGTSFEGSVPYHRLAVELFTLALLHARGAGLQLGEAYEDSLRGMFRAVRSWCSEEGRAPQIGDNDSGRVWALQDREDLDHGYLVPFGAALFQDASLKAGTFPDEAAWLLGVAGREHFDALPAACPPISASYPSMGLHVLRGGGATVTVVAGLQGQRGIGGHSHNDKLSFELHLGGKPVIVDPGTGTYTREPELRNFFRSTAAHNTLELDGAEQAPLDPARLFALPDTARAQVDVLQVGASMDRLTVSHQGYQRLAAPVRHVRTFLLDKSERALVIMDRLEGRGMHEVVGRLHLPDEAARLRPATDEERARAGGLTGAPRELCEVAVEVGPKGAARAVVLLGRGAVPCLERSRYSPGYGRVEPALQVCVRTRVEVPDSLRWVVLFN